MSHMAREPKESIDVVVRRQAMAANIANSFPVGIFWRRPEPKTVRLTDHCSSPIKGYESGSRSLRDVANVRLAQVVHQKTADRNFCSHIDENSNRAENKLPILP